MEVTIGLEVLARLDEVRGHEPRASFVKRALEAALAPGDREIPSTVVLAVKEAWAEGTAENQMYEDPGAFEAARQAVRAVEAGATTPRFKCRSCDFSAGSAKAKCPRHGGALVPA